MVKATAKEKGFVADYIETKNGTEAAMRNYDTDSRDTAGVIASQNLAKLRIQRMIDDAREGAQQTIVELSQRAKNENVKLNASKDILDRGGLKPKEGLDITSDGQPLGVIILPKKDLSE